MKDIIGLVGFAGSGKDTVGNILRDDFGYTKYSFAKPLKDIISILFSWDRDLLEGSTQESRIWRETPDEWWNEKLQWDVKHQVKFTPRICLQYFGTDLLRNHFDENIWIIVMERFLKEILDNNSKVVITDCRFKNEIDSILKNNGEIIRVKRGDDPEWFDYARNNIIDYHNQINGSNLSWLEKLSIHQSEVDWLYCNPSIIIDNNGSISDIKNYFL